MTAANANAVVSQISVHPSASRTEITRARRWKTPRSRARRTRMKLRKQIHRTTTHLHWCGSLAGCVDASVAAGSSVELRVDDWTTRRVRAATPYQLAAYRCYAPCGNADDAKGGGRCCRSILKWKARARNTRSCSRTVC